MWIPEGLTISEKAGKIWADWHFIIFHPVVWEFFSRVLTAALSVGDCSCLLDSSAISRLCAAFQITKGFGEMLFHPTSGMTIRCVEHLLIGFQDFALVFAVKPAGQGPKHLGFCSWSQVSKCIDGQILASVGIKTRL